MGTAKLVDDAIMAEIKDKKGRGYLGFSQLGDECAKKVWYSYWLPKPVEDPRIKRIFDMGHMLEPYVVSLLRLAGLTVYEVDENGEQFGVILEGGKIAGHIDGVITGLPESSVPHLLEIKTANNTNYNQLVKKGVKNFSDTYYGQVQCYMGEMDLARCLFVAINKNNCELYFERIKYDSFIHKALIERGIDIVGGGDPPPRAYGKSTYYRCNFCNYKSRCWDEE